VVCALVEVIEVIEVKGRGVEAGAGQGEVRWEARQILAKYASQVRNKRGI